MISGGTFILRNHHMRNTTTSCNDTIQYLQRVIDIDCTHLAEDDACNSSCDCHWSSHSYDLQPTTFPSYQHWLYPTMIRFITLGPWFITILGIVRFPRPNVPALLRFTQDSVACKPATSSTLFTRGFLKLQRWWISRVA